LSLVEPVHCFTSLGLLLFGFGLRSGTGIGAGIRRWVLSHRFAKAFEVVIDGTLDLAGHQRTFVIEVMGRRCGYLALMGGLATGSNFVLIPENPPNDGWKDAMCDVLSGGRTIGRRANIVLVAEGATDVHGDPVTVGDVKQALEERLGEDDGYAFAIMYGADVHGSLETCG